MSRPVPVALPLTGTPIIEGDPKKGVVHTSWMQTFVNWQGAIKAPANTVAPPKTSNSPGAPGQIAFDQNFFYSCIGKNQWARAPLSTAF